MYHFDAKTMSKRLADFAYAEVTFRALSGEVRAHPKALSEFRKALTSAAESTKAIGLADANGHCEELLKRTKDGRLSASVLMAHAQRAGDALRNGLARRKFLYVPESLAECLDNDQLFGERVWKKFPKARIDITEAGNCLAADCNTAAVFTLMRVAEHGIRAVARRLKAKPIKKGAHAPLEYSDWNAVITAIQGEIKTSRGRVSPVKEKQLNFYSDIADQAEWIKDLYRNEVSHTRKAYNAPEAMGAMNRIRDFMVRIATDLRGIR